MDGNSDRVAEQTAFLPAASGSIFRIIDFPSMTDEEMARMPLDTMSSQIGHIPSSPLYRPPTHPFMHRTPTLDYAIVLSGEIEMKLDDDEPLALRAGDVVVQQGTNHAWINRSGAVCRIAFVLLGAADPLSAVAVLPAS